MGPVISYKVDQATLPTTATRYRSIPSCVTSLSTCPTINTLSVSKLRCRSATGAGKVARLSWRASDPTLLVAASSWMRKNVMQRSVPLAPIPLRRCLTNALCQICVGSHQNGPLAAHLFDSPSRSLFDLICTDPKAYLGEKLSDTRPSMTKIPYYIDVLSIRKTVPLQAHPDLKGLAGQLRQSNPDNFIDANFRKPQIAVAIGEPLCIARAQYGGEGRATVGHAEVDDADTAFMGFVGFRPLEEIKAFLEKIPELVAAVDEPALVIKFTQSPSNELLKQVYAKLLNRGAEAQEEVAAAVNKLRERMMQNGVYVLGSPESVFLFRLFMKVNAQYPGDVGVLATTFFMNFVKLRKGEALYIGADEVYAYMEGGMSPFDFLVPRF